MKNAGSSNYAIFYNAERKGITKRDGIIRRWAFGNGGGSPDLLIQALVSGYEVEKTPEDKIRSYYADAIKLSQEAMYSDGKSIAIGRITAIRQTLNYLGIKYEGVNA